MAAGGEGGCSLVATGRPPASANCYGSGFWDKDTARNCARTAATLEAHACATSSRRGSGQGLPAKSSGPATLDDPRTAPPDPAHLRGGEEVAARPVFLGTRTSLGPRAWVPNYCSVREHESYVREKFDEDVAEGLMEKMNLREFQERYGEHRAIAALAVIVEDEAIGKKRVIHDGPFSFIQTRSLSQRFCGRNISLWIRPLGAPDIMPNPVH